MLFSKLGQSGKGTALVPPPASSSALFYQETEVNGVLFPMEHAWNFIDTPGIRITGTDSPGIRTNLTFDVTTCDHIIVTEADLPPLVGSSHILTSGSWCFVADIDLGANNIVIPAGVRADLIGMETTLTSTFPGPVVDISTDTSQASINGLSVTTNAGPGGSGIRSRCPAGTFNMISNTRCFGDIGILHESNGLIVEHFLGSNSDQIIRQDGATTKLIVKSARMLGANFGIFVALGESLQVWGSWLEFMNAAIGFGGAPFHASVIGNEFANMGTGVDVSAPGMQDLKIRGNDFTLLGTGIAMPAANTPVGGLSMMGNAFSLVGANFTGFVVNPPAGKVNSKANLGGGGLLTETTIVP